MFENVINFKKLDKYEMKDIIQYLSNIEKMVAKNNNRCDVEIQTRNIDTPYYDLDENIIVLPDMMSKSQLMKFTVSLVHESEHANQELSPLKSDDDKMLLKISSSVYYDNISPDFKDIQYVCNYREVCARLEEAKCLIELYKNALNQTGILSVELAKDFQDAISNTLEFVEPINKKHLKEYQKWIMTSIKRDEYSQNFTEGLSKKDIITFLKRVVPKMFKNKLNEINFVRRDLLKIQKDLNISYVVNLDKTTNQLAEFKTAEREQHRNDIMQMYEGQTISHINISPHENHDIYEFDCFDDFKSFINKTLNDNKEAEIYTKVNIDDDKYIVFLPQKEPSFADNVLDGPETHNITTSLENIDIEK